MKIEIPPLEEGECADYCPGFLLGSHPHCYINEIISCREDRNTPGPLCPGPGVHELVPECVIEYIDAEIKSHEASNEFYTFADYETSDLKAIEDAYEKADAARIEAYRKFEAVLKWRRAALEAARKVLKG